MSTAYSREELTKKIDELRASGSFDLSTEEDLSIGAMHLVNLEEHLYFTAQKTGKDEYFDMLNQIRSMRKDVLGKMIPRHEGETWCTCKHLLGATMRMYEVGTKLLSDGNTTEAKEMFDRAHALYQMFWGLRLKLITMQDVRAEAAAEAPMTLKDIVNKLVDCCNE